MHIRLVRQPMRRRSGIIGPTIRAGETYALNRDMSEADALAEWMGEAQLRGASLNRQQLTTSNWPLMGH